LESRNPIFTETGAIDCEINHPQFGWIPFTASADDVEMIGREFFALHKDNAAPYVEPPIPPAPPEMLECSPAQMRVALHRAGLLDQVQALVDADPEAAIVWEYATTIVRQSPFIDALGKKAFTPEQIDDLFRAAMALVL
jgi:hypothetical protein